MRSRNNRRGIVWFAAAAFVLLVGSCAVQDGTSTAQYRWWSGLGPVLPHDSFPADCKLCHMGSDWNTLVPTFEFDHERETGYALAGAHAEARCLRCHNDRGPVQAFVAKGCGGCHEDVHRGDLGARCTKCHGQHDWQPVGQRELHSRSRFPLTGAHAATACHKCHPGARVGKFLPADTECLTCHQPELAGTNNPPHIPLGWVDHCERCHIPTVWRQARAK